mgnify:CR=1 FL=1
MITLSVRMINCEHNVTPCVWDQKKKDIYVFSFSVFGLDGHVCACMHDERLGKLSIGSQWVSRSDLSVWLSWYETSIMMMRTISDNFFIKKTQILKISTVFYHFSCFRGPSGVSSNIFNLVPADLRYVNPICF